MFLLWRLTKHFFFSFESYTNYKTQGWITCCLIWWDDLSDGLLKWSNICEFVVAVDCEGGFVPAAQYPHYLAGAGPHELQAAGAYGALHNNLPPSLNSYPRPPLVSDTCQTCQLELFSFISL